MAPFDSKYLVTGEKRFDAADSIFFARELETILKENFDPKMPELKGRQMVPIDNQYDAGTEIMTYESYTEFGAAKRISDMADDLPQVGVNGTEASAKFKSYGVAFGYSVDEIKAAAKAGKPLERMRAQAARKALEIKFDNILADGDGSLLDGLFTLDDTNSSYTAMTKSSGDTEWDGSGVLPEEILADLEGVCGAVETDSLDTEKVTRILLPTDLYRLVKNMRLSSNTDMTVLKFFLENNPDVSVAKWERLSAAGSGSSRRMLAYNPTPLNVRALVAVDFEMEPPEKRNYKYVVNMRFKTGGVISPYPKSIAYVDHV